MRASQLLVLALLGLVSACLGLAYLLREPAAERALVQPARPEPISTASAARDLPAQDDEVSDAEAVAARLDLERMGGRRALGWVPPAGDTLHPLRGRVIEAVSERPVAGMRLSLLSPRPRTCTVVTDADGRFETGVVLAAGVVSVLHVPDESELRFKARWELEPGEFLVTGRDAPVLDVVLRARSPETVLEVDIVLPDGTVAPGAAVSLTSGRRDEHGLFVPDSRDYEIADQAGRARFALFGDDVMERTFELEAEHDGRLASDVMTLDPPLSARPQHLDLQPGGVVRVRTRNDEDHPVAGVSLWVSSFEVGHAQTGRNGTSDALGECVFAGLRAGCYTVTAVHPLSGETMQKEVDLGRGAQAALDFHMTLANLRLGASGTVVDELGRPLADTSIRVHVPGERAYRLASGPNGRFEFWSRPCTSLLLSAGEGYDDDEFEPAQTVVPFGTTGIEVRRTRELERHSLPFEARDRESKAPARRARITLFHGRGGADPASPAQQSFHASAGVAQVEFKLREDTLYAVDAPGYLRASGRLSDLCESFRDRAALRVELERGFERRVVVMDRVMRRPLANASLADGTKLAGTTGADGALLLHASEWPLSLRVECAGYEPLVWDPLAEFPGEVIWLEPLRARR